MTEGSTKLADEVIRPSYEQIVEGIRHSGVREILRHAEDNEQRINRELERISENEDLNEEAKERMAQEVLDKYEPKISEAYKSAKEKVEASAESSYRFSIPMPGDSKTLATTRAADASEVLAIQNETTALIARAEQLKTKASASDRSHARGNDGIRLSYDPAQRVLKDAFDKAMVDGGIQGKITGLAVVKAADALGVDVESIVEDHRRQVHYNALNDMHHFQRAWRTLPSKKRSAANSFIARRSSARRIGTYQSANKTMVRGTDVAQVFARKPRKRAWK
jgi:hypothetical protein